MPAVPPVVALLAVATAVILLLVTVILVRHDVMVIMMRPIRVAVLVVAGVMMIVMDHIGIVAALHCGDSIPVIAAFIMRLGADRAETDQAA